MRNLPTIPGLLIEAAMQREYAKNNNRRARSTSGDPRMAHEAEIDAKSQTKKAAALDEKAAELVGLVREIEELISFLTSTRCTSPHITLAKRALEDASMRLRREIGDSPESLNK